LSGWNSPSKLTAKLHKTLLTPVLDCIRCWFLLRNTSRLKSDSLTFKAHPKLIRKEIMSALTILIIWHAEKQGEFWPGSDLMPDEVPNKKSFLIRGWQRAGSWSALFGAGLGGLDYPTPSVIDAADSNATTGDEPSQHPFETVTPLVADRLDLTPDTTYAVGRRPNSPPGLSAKPAWCLSLESTSP
jgi:hypothetical protein